MKTSMQVSLGVTSHLLIEVTTHEEDKKHFISKQSNQPSKRSLEILLIWIHNILSKMIMRMHERLGIALESLMKGIPVQILIFIVAAVLLICINMVGRINSMLWQVLDNNQRDPCF